MKAKYYKVQKDRIKFLENIEPKMLNALIDACLKYNSNYIYVMFNLEPSTIVKMNEPISYMRPDTDIVKWCEEFKYEYKGNYIDNIQKRKLKLLKIQGGFDEDRLQTKSI